MDIYTKALVIATKAHDEVGQRRKYVSEPYIVHPIRVSGMVMEALDGLNYLQGYVKTVGAAAVLHDVLEDTKVGEEELLALLGVPDLTGVSNPEGQAKFIVGLVKEVTNPSKGSSNLSRSARKAMDLQHLAKTSYLGATIKLADIIDNTGSIVKHDPGFAPVYLKEKKLALDVLSHGHKGLLAEARGLIEAGMNEYDMLTSAGGAVTALAAE